MAHNWLRASCKCTNLFETNCHSAVMRLCIEIAKCWQQATRYSHLPVSARGRRLLTFAGCRFDSSTNLQRPLICFAAGANAGCGHPHDKGATLPAIGVYATRVGAKVPHSRCCADHDGLLAELSMQVMISEPKAGEAPTRRPC